MSEGLEVDPNPSSFLPLFFVLQKSTNLASTMSKLHTDSTSAAQHKTQGKRKADRWKIDCERRREEHKTLLRLPSPNSQIP